MKGQFATAIRLFQQIAENFQNLKINIEQYRRSGYNGRNKTFRCFFWYFKEAEICLSLQSPTSA